MNATSSVGESSSSSNLRRRNTWLLLWLVASLLVAMTWLHVYSLVSESRQREISNAQRDLSNLTRLSQEHANRTLRSADQVIRFVQSRYLELGNRLDLIALTKQGIIDTEIFNQVGIIDPNGIYVLANRPIAEKIDLSDREHFKVHVAADTGALFVSKPVIGRATGKWSIQLTRRITKANGGFGGVVVISIDPNYFTQFYGELNLGPGGMNAIYGLDGIARARRVGDTVEFGSNAAASTLFQQRLKEVPTGSYVQKSVVDGVERLFYYRMIPGYALLTVSGVDMRYLLANHDESSEALYRQGALVTLLIFALATGLTRHLWLLRREAETREAAQVQIEDRRKQLDEVFDLSPDGFVSFDKFNCLKSVNLAFRHMTGASNLSLEGLDEKDFSAWLVSLCEPAAKFEGLTNLRQKAHKNAANAYQVIEIKDFGHRVLQVQLRLSESTTVSQILYLRDITHETAVESMKSEFLATAAHELRTPMASIYGFAEILLTQATDAQSQNEFLGIIYKQSKLMIQILNELLDLARIEARRGKDFKFANLCLQDLLHDLIKAYQYPAGRTAPLLIAPPQPIYLMADSGKLRQALLNVISNAYKYSPDGGAVVIRLVVRDASGQTPQICIEVEDHGIGMTIDQANKVFTRFYRADSSGKLPGTGLGMSITKEIVEHHKGDISLVSAPGQGTQVSMVFPIQQDFPSSGSAPLSH